MWLIELIWQTSSTYLMQLFCFFWHVDKATQGNEVSEESGPELKGKEKEMNMRGKP